MGAREMRVYINTDLEGVCGVYRFEQSRDAFGSAANVEARHLLMGEVNAAVAGCFDGGATRVVVRDGHDGAKSFFPDEIDERAEFVMGGFTPRDLVVSEGFDAGILLGYHAMSHTPRGVLCHTQSSTTWDNYWIDGELAGEIRQSSIFLGSHGIPVVMVTGDEAASAEARALLGDQVVTVAVKKGLSREAALMKAPKRARQLIREGAEQAMKLVGKIKPYEQKFPVTIRWQFKDSGIVDRYSGPGKIIDGQTIERRVDSADAILGP